MFDSVVRVYRIPPRAREDIQEFLDKVSKHVMTPVASISVKDDMVRVELVGPRSQIAESLEAIKRLFKEYEVEMGGKAKVYTFGKIEELAGMGVPVDTVEELLKLKGFPARRRAKKSIETEAPKRAVIEEASKIAEAYKKMRGIKMSKTTAKMIAVASAYLRVDPSEVIEEALKLGLVEKDPERGLGMSYVWRGILRELVKAYKMKMGSS